MKKRKRRILRFVILLLILLGLLAWGLAKLYWENANSAAGEGETAPGGKVQGEEETGRELSEPEGTVPEEQETPTPSPSAVPTSTPTPSPTPSQEELLEMQVEEKLASMTQEEKVAQLFFITPEALTGTSQVQAAGEVTRERFGQYPVGGIIYFQHNLSSEEQTREMLTQIQQISRDRIGLPLFTGVDEEGGTVTRVAGKSGFSALDVGDMRQIGASEDPEQAYQVGLTIGSYLADLGFNVDFAPCADVLTNPENTVVARRSFGSDPELVAQMVCREMDGLEEMGVFACPKHFPGHGATRGDTHQGYSYTEKTWEELESQELVPFVRAVERGTDFLMVGHISLPNALQQDLPASLSQEVITGVLREKLGYQGLVITDALNMGAIQNVYSSGEAAVAALLAGGDLLLMPADFAGAYSGVLEAVQTGVISSQRLDDSVSRILRVKLAMESGNSLD
ncbi:MAG TPA: glycoside hydrolase family 3 protein [Candidatus Egerieimonas intestinavium]|uniref:beta-N-acetylhexosaminidase n=1 Tax=Candidatus Egerieimonas intestinavium TaxID=2840777 RepID=A0A9D1JGC8_9FIRM|nr:glycoside hydrolase family 3 protein [Candidatus Egerieimonas intestinavium]